MSLYDAVDRSWVLYVCDLCYCVCVTCVIEISHAVDLSRVLHVCDLCYCMCVTCVIVYVCDLCTRNITCC